ncbi:peptidyl-prolyl cis-trans isomerase [Paenibacillus lemnae]|uniref:peptidylprolyl isomerase n=1 Tax=Paenibacillus lemnae TaxID=1330551 RepID=A0A848M968_PAELE|nr:peptidyl-prolyl cis-trans isomerase [Paenibacillus lemnae]NMO97768.1 peptidylprolyl isomerase [Paenibacillus lemnae]
MTRQEKALWTTVMALSVALLFLGSWMLFSGALFKEQRDPRSNADSPAVATVQDRAITEEEWNQELKKRYGSEVLMTMMNRQVVDLEAQKAGIEMTMDEVDLELKRMGQAYGSMEIFLQEMQQQLGLSEDVLRAETEYRLKLEKIATADIQIEEAEIDDYLAEHPDQFRPKKQLDLSIIKVADEALADDVMDRLERGEPFADLASELSIDEYTKENGGRLGLIEEDDPFQPEELMMAVSELSKGDIAGPIVLEDGYIIVYVRNILVPEKEDEQLVRETVRRQMALERSESLSELEQRLRDKYAARIVAGVLETPGARQ